MKPEDRSYLILKYNIDLVSDHYGYTIRKHNIPKPFFQTILCTNISCFSIGKNGIFFDKLLAYDTRNQNIPSVEV